MCRIFEFSWSPSIRETVSGENPTKPATMINCRQFLKENQLMKRLFYTVVAALLIPALAGAQKPSARHPDLSGLWLFSISLPSTALKKEVNGKVEINRVDASGRRGVRSDIPGVLPSAPAPSYKPEFRRKYLVRRRGIFSFRRHARYRTLLARWRKSGVPGNRR